MAQGEFSLPTIAVRDESQSTLTIDVSGNAIQSSPAVSGVGQYENVNLTRGWDIAASINSMNGVDRTQCQFGYYNNDEFSFNDGTGMIYFALFLNNGGFASRLFMMLCCKVPKAAWSTFALGRTGGGAQWQELTAGEAGRNAQQALAEVICYYMNNHAVEVRMAPVTPAGVDWKNAAYVDADGNVNTYAAFAASNITFVPGGTSTLPMTQNFITVETDPAWTAFVYFMDGPFSIYNTVGGAFASGMGTYARRMQVDRYEFGPLPFAGAVTLSKTANFASPFPYLFNEGMGAEVGPGSIVTPPRQVKPLYFPVSAANTTMVDYPGYPLPVKQTGAEYSAMRFSTVIGIGLGSTLPFSRATTLLNSKYYIAFAEDLYYGSNVSHTGNASIPSSVMGILESTADKRNEWAEYTGEAINPVQQTTSSVQTVNYHFRNDQAEPLVCMSNVAFPLAPPTIPVFTEGQLAHFPDFEWVSMYFETTDPAGTFPILPSAARVKSDTFVAAFQTARKSE